MASYNTVITNEGAALLASVIANQGTLTFSEMRFSTTDYDGVEQTLTVGTFGGVFITAATSGSVVDATTIKVAAQFDNSGIVGDHPLYSIGIVGTDGNTTALIAVCTTTNPDIIRAALTGVSTYAFNVNLAVSSTLNITVTGTTAAVLYDTDVVDNLISTATNKPLSANQGRLVADNLAANEESGAKNQLDDDDYSSIDNMDKSGHTFTSNNTDTRSPLYLYIDAWEGTTLIQTLVSENIASTGHYEYSVSIPNNTNRIRVLHNGSQRNIGVVFNTSVTGSCIISLDITGVDPTTVGGLSFENIMIRDDRIIDPTFAPFAKTNLQLTNDKAERNDLSTIHATGSTNTTGSTITAGTFFYLNDQFCKALADIAVNATFTLNTNFKVDTVDSGKLNKDWNAWSFQNAISNNGSYDASALVALGKSILFRVIVKTGTYANYSHEWAIEKFTSDYNLTESFTLETGLIRLGLTALGIFTFISSNTTECSEIYLDIFFR